MPIIDESFAGVATSATRVVELYQPPEKRLFDDPYALTLLPPGWRVFFQLAFLPGVRQVVLALRERRMPGSLGGILCRTRYMDDVVCRWLEAGLDQLVILGAGFDSRAYRIAGIDAVAVYEVDLPGTEALKQRRLEKVLGAVPPHVTLVGIDFDRENLGDVLDAAGYQAGQRTLFLWEGVTQYLSADAVDATLRLVAESAGQGSAIAFTYVLRELIEGTAGPDWFHSFADLARRLGSPLTFGLDRATLPGYLAARGLTLIDDVGADDYQRRYLQPLGRDLTIFDAERLAVAEVA